MKITVSRRSSYNRFRIWPLGLSHSGFHLKFRYGGPRFLFRYINGFSVYTRSRIVWVELWRSHRSGPFFLNRAALPSRRANS